MIEAADQLDAVGDGLAAQDPLVVRAELRGQVGRQEVEVGLAEDVFAPAQPQVQEVGDVDPLVPARPVLDPEDDVLQEVEQLADRLAGKLPGHDGPSVQPPAAPWVFT